MSSDYPLRVLVCGGRDYDDRDRVWEVLDGLRIAAICDGRAKGADELAGEYARMNNITHHVYPAEWEKHGKSAGPIRNRRMLDDFNPDVVVAFPGGKGTAHMVSIAKSAGVEVLLVDASGSFGVLADMT